MYVLRVNPRGVAAGVVTTLAVLLLLSAPPPVPAASPSAHGAALVRVSAAPAAFSPNGDGTLDKVVVTVRLARAGALSVGVYDAEGRLVRSLQKVKKLAAGARTYTWNGRAKDGPSGDGIYTIRAKVRTGRKASTARCTVTVDTRPPIVRLTSDIEPRVFAGGGLTVALPYTVDEVPGTRLTLGVYHPKAESDGLGAALGSLDVGAAKATGEVSWDGRAVPDEWLPSSRYRLVLVATDVAGNAGSSPALGASVFAPTEVKGRVVTPQGAPVEGAEVDAVGTSVKAVTGADGSFTLTDCPMGLRVLRAQKDGMEAGGTGARVNMAPASWTITMGRQTKGTSYPGLPAKAGAAQARGAAGVRRTAEGAPTGQPAATGSRHGHAPGGRAWPWDDVVEWFDSSSTYTMSGSFSYKLKDGVTSRPMRNVNVVLRDVVVDAFGVQFTDDIATSSTDSSGNYQFTYTVDWDDFGTPDVVVCALSEDEDVAIVDVKSPGPIGDTWACTGEYWENNAQDRLDRHYTAAGSNRMVWWLVDAVRAANGAGYVRGTMDVVYPSWVASGNGCYQNYFDTIQIAEGSGWGDTIWHEYGHAWMHAAYSRGGGSNAYNDYEWDADSGYSSFFSVEDPWTAFREGWAQFMALRMDGRDNRPGETPTFECDYDTPSVDDSRVINSVARVLWDLYDAWDTHILYTWIQPSSPSGSRLTSLYGPGDDDAIPGPGTSGLESSLRSVLDTQHPANVDELRARLREAFPSNAVLRRSIDGCFYRQGVTNNVQENAPHVDAGSVVVTNQDSSGPPHAGTLALWCRVTDPDALGGVSDLTWTKVRFEGRWSPSGATSDARAWAPLCWTASPAPGPPPGRSGTGWFKADWDTTHASPVEIVPVAPLGPPLFAKFDLNEHRDENVVTATTTGGTARRDHVWVRAIAFDGLAESAPVESAVFAVNNGPTQGVSGAVKNALTQAPIAGATVELRRGTTSVAGMLVGTATTGSDGAYSFPDVAAGGYTAIASTAGFATNHRALTVEAGTSLTGQDILLTPDAQPSTSMRSALDGYIRWQTKTDYPAATYEVWYRPFEFGGMEYGLDVAQISRDYTDWKGDGLKRWPIMLIWCGDGEVTFQVNENVDDESGVWHRVSGSTRMRLGQWYHIAAQTGPQGLKLYVNGHLEDSDPGYTKGAEANNGAAPTSGWFSLGDNQTVGSGHMTAVGDFRGLRVSKVQRYSGDFTPPAVPVSDANSVITDPLAGSTNGDNRYFVPTPAGP